MGQFGPAFRLNQVGDVAGVEGGADLRVQVDAIHHDEDGGVLQAGLQTRSFCAAKTMSSDLRAPLKMPDQPLARSARQYPFHDLVGRVDLLVADHDLDTPVPGIGGEERIVGQHIQ